MQESLLRDPVVCNLIDHSEYYYELGIRVASLLEIDREKKPEEQQGELLCDALLKAMHTRWGEVVTQMGRVGVAHQHLHPLNAGSSFFPATLTIPEQAMVNGGKEAERHFKKWMDRFAVSCIERSNLVEAPSKKLRTK